MKDEARDPPRYDEVIELYADLDMRPLAAALSRYIDGNGTIEAVRREGLVAARGLHSGRIAPHTMLVALRNALREAGGDSARVGAGVRIRMTSNQLLPWLIELVFDPAAQASLDDGISA